MNQVKRIRTLSDCGAHDAALRAEHCAIEDALDTLDEAAIAGAGAEHLRAILDNVIEFMEAHFQDEEQFFAGIEYSAAGAHVRAHAAMLKRLRAARDGMPRQDSAANLDVSSLIMRFHDHVATYDRTLAEHVQRQREARNMAEPATLTMKT